jgi:hypothetical protein
MTLGNTREPWRAQAQGPLMIALIDACFSRKPSTLRASAYDRAQ